MTRLIDPRGASDSAAMHHPLQPRDNIENIPRQHQAPQKPASRPKKLQKNRRDAFTPIASAIPVRRTTSLDIASLSDNSHRALVNAQITVTSRYQYPSSRQRSVLKKRRDGHMPNYQPVHPPPPELADFRPNAQRLSSQQHPHEQKTVRFNNKPPSEIPYYHFDGSDAELPPPNSIPEGRFSADKPLPPMPQDTSQDEKRSDLVESSSPDSIHRRWTITSYHNPRAEPNDILVNDMGELKRSDPFTSNSHPQPRPTSVPPTANSNSHLPLTPQATPPPIEKDVSQVKLQRLLSEMISTQHAYLHTLRSTVNNHDHESCSPPVNLLLSLLSIIQVSEDFLRRMEQNPTPQGVADAFLATCGTLEFHLLQWSQEVTEFVNTQSFEAGAGVGATHYHSAQASEERRRSRLKRWKNFFRRKGSSSEDASEDGEQPKAVLPDSFWRRSSAGPGLWEMVVLPTQRTMRYVFLFRELLLLLDMSHRDYQIVERAFHAANIIAKKMTRAQQRPSL
ncbi:hypothetical protein CC1G_06582 [Coprinopsis cinerea okayama7|uniref:DH domain-containing protein n=1 Tax=Coprinopsis cinerea (strain Okayama-7 / 130 / ATCC MYA-4618 / FGSC 9003) TaxID=240176 RepID=A8N310_COPC7|nr:hypothetical protein CC1G_06582 [Coprinopsis cinerea okayama7\|eukprot:XP_001829245.2 hypothetical protein CC1G_06582 [Coprinopsis cinerea okayama7\